MPNQRKPVQGPFLLPRQPWRNWPELGIKIRGLPDTTTTLQIYAIFCRHGNLDTVELFEDRNGNRDGCARVRFRPPPGKPFWVHNDGRYTVDLAISGLEAAVLELQLEESRRSFQVASPVNSRVRYPERTLILAKEADFGFMFDPTNMMIMHSVSPPDLNPVQFEVNLGRRIIDVQFEMPFIDPRAPYSTVPRVAVVSPDSEEKPGSLNRVERYRFRIPLQHLREILETHSDAKSHVLLLSLDHPPNFYRKAVGAQLVSSHDDRSNWWNEWDTWFRTTDIMYDPRSIRGSSITLKKVRPLLDIGRWTTYRFRFERSAQHNSAFDVMRAALRDYNIPILERPGFGVRRECPPPVWQWIDKPAAKVNGPAGASGSYLAELTESSVPRLSFAVRYLLEVCISQGYLSEYNLSKAFADKLASTDEQQASDILEAVALKKARVYDPMTIFDMDVGKTKHLKIPHYCIYARKAIITPSMVYFGLPSVETSNRVMRQYIEHADRFIRVQFADEKTQGRINSTDKATNNEVLTRIQRAMMNGIDIGDRHFEFLAFGNSQFREHGAFFFSPTPHLQTASIRAWMGDFTEIRVPAKYAARLGQCFSTTRAINGTRVQIIETPDVERGGFVFTDGVGKISEFLAQMIAFELKLGTVPSTIQFRLGGCKGVLTWWPDVRGRAIHIRRSQYKFDAVHCGLEINRWSQFGAASLNRQIILVLSALGVEDAAFHRKLEHMLKNLARAMEDQAVAVQLLLRYIDPNQMTVTMTAMILDGFMTARDPFMLSLLQLWRAWSIKYLKERAKIIIEDGAFVLGCTDETQTLQGHFDDLQVSDDADLADRLKALPEIFIQVPSREDPKKYVVIQGLCLLGRNPSLHPGDIRVVRAVDKPGLQHLRDVVVLPQTGDRDIASMCSGGDLDGDDFLVIWDPELLPRQWNHPAMDYSAPKATELDRQVTTRDIVSFFVNYMKNDRLPQIALAHMARADRFDAGIKDHGCLQLAALHSKAVDYVKSGNPAVMPRDLRPRTWPHFMEKKHVPKEHVYVSRKILGQLYDQVERRDFVPCYDEPFDKRILHAYAPPSDEVLDKARSLKRRYDIEMQRIMAQYDIKTEFEVWSTFVLGFSDRSRDYKFHEEIGAISLSLRDRFRAACVESAGGSDFEILGPFVAACYIVTEQEVTAALSQTREVKFVAGEEQPKRKIDARHMPRMSFPWCYSDVLGKIATLNTSTSEELERAKEVAAEAMRATEAKKRDWSKISVVAEEMQPCEVTEVPDLPEMPAVETAEGLTQPGEVLELFHEKKAADWKGKGKAQDDSSQGGSGQDEVNQSLISDSDKEEFFRPIGPGPTRYVSAGPYIYATVEAFNPAGEGPSGSRASPFRYAPESRSDDSPDSSGSDSDASDAEPFGDDLAGFEGEEWSPMMPTHHGDAAENQALELSSPTLGHDPVTIIRHGEEKSPSTESRLSDPSLVQTALASGNAQHSTTSSSSVTPYNGVLLQKSPALDDPSDDSDTLSTTQSSPRMPRSPPAPPNTREGTPRTFTSPGMTSLPRDLLFRLHQLATARTTSQSSVPAGAKPVETVKFVLYPHEYQKSATVFTSLRAPAHPGPTGSTDPAPEKEKGKHKSNLSATAQSFVPRTLSASAAPFVPRALRAVSAPVEQHIESASAAWEETGIGKETPVAAAPPNGKAVDDETEESEEDYETEIVTIGEIEETPWEKLERFFAE